MGYYGFKPYVCLAKRRKKAERKMNKLRKQGIDIQPLCLETQRIAHTFWGKAWCDRIESFRDDENRLARGRTYVRNGSVCHLAISSGCIEAMVSGSSVYTVKISIKPLPAATWKNIRTKCAGKIGSLLELLSGKLSDSVMQMVCHETQGLFPLASDIQLDCSCPDWADMCKHVAAVLYGVGARLDCEPEKLFLLRAVNHHELIDTEDFITNISQDKSSTRRRLSDASVEAIFAVDFVDEKSALLETETESSFLILPAKKVTQPLTGAVLKKIRIQLGLTQREFGSRVGVSATTISKWENYRVEKPILRKSVRKALQKMGIERSEC